MFRRLCTTRTDFYTSEQKKTGFGSYWNRKAEAEDQGKMDPDTGVGAY